MPYHFVWACPGCPVNGKPGTPNPEIEPEYRVVGPLGLRAGVDGRNAGNGSPRESQFIRFALPFRKGRLRSAFELPAQETSTHESGTDWCEGDVAVGPERKRRMSDSNTRLARTGLEMGLPPRRRTHSRACAFLTSDGTWHMHSDKGALCNMSS